MNTVQDIKLTQRNPLHFYTQKMRKLKEKLRKQFHSLLQQKHKILEYIYVKKRETDTQKTIKH